LWMRNLSGQKVQLLPCGYHQQRFIFRIYTLNSKGERENLLATYCLQQTPEVAFIKMTYLDDLPIDRFRRHIKYTYDIDLNSFIKAGRSDLIDSSVADRFILDTESEYGISLGSFAIGIIYGLQKELDDKLIKMIESGYLYKDMATRTQMAFHRVLRYTELKPQEVFNSLLETITKALERLVTGGVRITGWSEKIRQSRLYGSSRLGIPEEQGQLYNLVSKLLQHQMSPYNL